jgi:hypothetical protein
MPRQQIDGLARLGNGQRIDHLVRALWQRAGTEGETFGDPLDPVTADAFVSWMRGPAERGARNGVNRYLYAAYLTRPDLQTAFPDLDGRDANRLLRWARGDGRRDTLGELSAIAPPPSVNVIGFLGEALGLGEAARLYVSSLTAGHVGVSTTAVELSAGGDGTQADVRRDGAETYRDLVAATPPQFNLACVNADFLTALVAERGPDLMGTIPTIGQWGWETDALPPTWAGACDLVDEVWVYSRFVAENLGRLLPVPVVVVPPPVIAPTQGARLGLVEDDRFTFVTMLDFFSTPERKNPAGVIDAFKGAFGPNEGPRLIIKTLNATHRPEAVEALRRSAEGRSDIEFVDGYLTPEQKGSLLARADCFVSLHRSEGFGLGIAESMALGTPVLATAYSGNMDFTSPANSWLVDWHPTTVGPGTEVYPAGSHWAEPDLTHASAQLRLVRSDGALAAARADRGRRDIARLYAPEIVGLIARARLELLMDQRASLADNSWRAHSYVAVEKALEAAGSTYRRVRQKRRTV